MEEEKFFFKMDLGIMETGSSERRSTTQPIPIKMETQSLGLGFRVLLFLKRIRMLMDEFQIIYIFYLLIF